MQFAAVDTSGVAAAGLLAVRISPTSWISCVAFSPRRLLGPVPNATMQDIIISVRLWDFILSSARAAKPVWERLSINVMYG